MAFTTLNICRSFNQIITTTLVPLCSQECTEVIFVNRGAANVMLFDNGYVAAANGFLVKPDETFTVRGITNTDLVSASAAGASTSIYYRAQYYSHTLR